MRRALIKLGVLLLIGATANVAVAWGCAIALTPASFKSSSELSAYFENQQFSEPPHLTDDRFDQFGWTPRAETKDYAFKLNCAERRAFGARVSTLHETYHDKSALRGFCSFGAPEVKFIVSNVSAGFPVQALHGQCWADYRGTQEGEALGPFLEMFNSTFVYVDAVPYDSNVLMQGMKFPNADTVPLRPIWLGFVFNTIFYGAIVWGMALLVAAPVRLRRWRRVKRGLCAACAYPVGTSEVCTECGERVSRAGH